MGPIRNLKLITTCPICKQKHEVLVNREDYLKFQHNNLFVETAFPYLTASERELLITGTCDKCWDEMFLEE